MMPILAMQTVSGNDYNENLSFDFSMKPSQYFNQYFQCRYQLEHYLTNNNNNNGSSNVSNENNSINDNIQLRLINNKLSGNFNGNNFCPNDCDGVTMWPEIDTGSVQYIYCHNILENFQKISSELILDNSYVNDNFTPFGGNQNNGRASRRCTEEGTWEWPPNYSSCGIDVDKLVINFHPFSSISSSPICLPLHSKLLLLLSLH